MKTIKWFALVATSVALFSHVVKGFTIDGTASPGEYPAGQPLAVQTLGSNASTTDPTNGDVAVSSGSQLDAVYGVVSNGSLYLLIAGNMQCDPSSSNKYDKLSIFIDTGASGQNTLSNNNFDVDQPSALRRMSFGGDPINCTDPSCVGLTFDSGFNASYWIGLSYGGGDGTNPTLYVNYAYLPFGGSDAGGFGGFAGSVHPGATNTFTGFGITAAMNNSNIGGVDTNFCNVNTNGAAQSIAAATVQTGVELSIFLNNLGGPSAVGPIRAVAFLSTNDYTQIYDQLLGPVAIAGCVDPLAFGDPLTNNFSALPGAPHYFTIPIAGCSYSIYPFNASYDRLGGSSSFTVGAIGGPSCGWSVTSSVPWLVITSPTVGSDGGSVTYTVGTNSTPAVRTGTITLTGTANGQDVFTVTQGGVQLAPDFAVDGTADPAYGCPIAVQQIGTGFAHNTNTSIMAANGSELDAAYGMVENNTLFLFLAGNLQNNGNKLQIFFMTGPGGQNTLTNVNPSADGDLNLMGVKTNNPTFFPGLTFDTGFAPNYWMEMNVFGSSFYVDYAQMWPGGTNSSGIATNGYFLGSNNGTNGFLTGVGSKNPFNIQATINNSATNGISGGPGGGVGCDTNNMGVAESLAAATVTNGVELGIPLAAIGSPTGTIAVCAFICGGDSSYMSNQILGPLGSNNLSFCTNNLGNITNTAAINLNNFPGQHYFLVGPEVRIKSIAAVAANMVVSFVPEANSNLTYQLQRASVLTTNTSWSNVGGLLFGTNGTLSATILPSQGSTNKPAQFYRIRQTPLGAPGALCP